jgi:hypothetical protein
MDELEIVAIPSDLPNTPESSLMPDLFRRGGVFEIHLDMIRKHPGDVLKIMTHTIIVRAEMRFSRDTIEYEALSLLFDEVQEGQIYPRYDIEVDADGTVRARR